MKSYRKKRRANRLMILTTQITVVVSLLCSRQHRRHAASAFTSFTVYKSHIPVHHPFSRFVRIRSGVANESSPSSLAKQKSTQHFASRKVSSRKTQLRWIAQTVKKIQVREASNKNNNSSSAEEDAQVLHGLTLLASARTASQVLEAGRLLERVMMTQSISIQERIVKACSMVGLLRQALALSDAMLDDNHIPSEICQDALCNALRRSGRVNRMEGFLLSLGEKATRENVPTSAVAFNTYLAALCDIVLDKDVGMIQRVENSVHQKTAALDRAWQWLSDARTTEKRLAVAPDTFSYATVIQAAAAVGNHTLVETIWTAQKERGVSPNIVSYNARLRALTKSKKSRREKDAEILDIWDSEITVGSIKPDKFSIDLILLPLIRAGRVGDVESLLDLFVKRNSDSVVSTAFTAFLFTIVEGGELSTARALFETYILTTLSPVMVGDAGGMIRMVRPMTRHFNILLEGYRRQSVEASSISATEAAAKEAWELYRLMIKSLSIRPDPYTLTSMMGVCLTSTELSELLFQAFTELRVPCSSVVLRAVLTAYGELGDASSALWLFLKFSPESSRTWNVMLNSLAKVAEGGGSMVVKPTTSNVARIFEDGASFTSGKHELTDLSHGSTIVEVVKRLLDVMSNQTTLNGLTAPPPDSQTFCLAATALQYGPTNAKLGNDILRSATANKIPADGRFINAVLRCFGADIQPALDAWKNEIRPKSLAYEKRARTSPTSSSRSSGKNLVAAYHGLLHVCGKANRPDIALRLVYAMNKEGLEPNEVSLNSYRSGSKYLKPSDNTIRSKVTRKLKLTDPYESLLYIECTKYDREDSRRSGERRVRIIV